jgi:hypothetical protein
MMDCHGLTSLQVHPREGGGTGFIGAVGIVRERFIPARAGYGTFEELSAAKKSVHPREGGVRPKSQRGGRAVNGSSPRGRGTGSRDRRPAPPHRFIPARAGYGGKDSRILSDSSVHPREGGVRSCIASHQAASGGSSPRGRGTAVIKRRTGLWFRFIPARAGYGLAGDG